MLNNPLIELIILQKNTQLVCHFRTKSEKKMFKRFIVSEQSQETNIQTACHLEPKPKLKFTFLI